MPAIARGAHSRYEEAPYQVVAIAASAGGLRALRQILAALPASFPVPLLLALHRGDAPAGTLVDVLRSRTGLAVREARQGERPLGGTVYVAPGGRHLELTPGGRLSVRRAGRINFVCPSADLLFASAARRYGSRALAVVLTGQGRDGAQGAKAVRNAGGYVLVQDRATSEHFGMPCSAIETRKPGLVLPLGEIAYTLEVLTRANADGRAAPARQPPSGPGFRHNVC
jgi:two-component system chemotaxis response regulator CheB